MLLIQSEYNYLLTIPQFTIGMFQTDVFKHSTDFLFFGFCSLCPNLSEVVIESIFAHNCLLLFFFFSVLSQTDHAVAYHAIESVWSTMAPIKTIPPTRLIVP